MADRRPGARREEASCPRSVRTQLRAARARARADSGHRDGAPGRPRRPARPSWRRRAQARDGALPPAHPRGSHAPDFARARVRSAPRDLAGDVRHAPRGRSTGARRGIGGGVVPHDAERRSAVLPRPRPGGAILRRPASRRRQDRLRIRDVGAAAPPQRPASARPARAALRARRRVGRGRSSSRASAWPSR